MNTAQFYEEAFDQGLSTILNDARITDKATLIYRLVEECHYKSGSQWFSDYEDELNHMAMPQDDRPEFAEANALQMCHEAAKRVSGL